MQLASQYEEEFLHLLTPHADLASGMTYGSQRLAELMVGEDVGRDAAGRGSELSYHTACVQLLADCCVGMEPELIVQASGYLQLNQIVDVVGEAEVCMKVKCRNKCDLKPVV